jgi:hypothetical protein
VSMTQAWLRNWPASRRQYQSLLLLVAIGIVGELSNSSPAYATALTVSQPFLYYENSSPSALFGAGGQLIGYGADSVTPNGNGGTTGFATVAGTNGTITRPISYQPSAAPLVPNFFSGAITLTTAINDGINLSSPWNITFHNSDTTPTSVSNSLSLVGSGELPIVNSVTISGTTAQPTFSWSPPLGATANGYRIQIWQNSTGQLVATTNLPATATSYSVLPSAFTVPGAQLTPNTTYTIGIKALQTKDGTADLDGDNSDINAISFAYSTFQVSPRGGGQQPIQLPTETVIGTNVTYGFNFTVQTGQTYFIDPAVATGYVYEIGASDPNFASVELPDIGNPSPYELYLWNGTDFVFDTMLAADTTLDFGGTGVSEFEVLGIDPSLGLDPTNPTAFVTALTFEGAGSFTGTMTPITTNVPEPTSLTLFVCGLLGFGSIRRRRKAFIR